MSFRKKLFSLFFPLLTNVIFCNGLEWESPDNYLSPAHKLTNLFAIPKDKRPTGKGIRVGIIDSGIDFTHPALGGCFGKNCRVQFGKSFYTDNEILPTHLKGTPYDNDGHGTQMAGIIGGKDENILGVAPDVIFGAYKVSNAEMSSYSSLINGIEMAIEDKMNIIVIAMDYPCEIKWDAISKYLNNTIVIVSAGNNGHLKTEMSLLSMANTKDFISVASATSDYYKVNQIELSSQNNSMIVTLTYLFVFPENANELINSVWISLDNVDPNNDDGCKGIIYPTLQGKVVLVNYDGCPIKTKVENLKHSNIWGVIVYKENNNYFDFDLSYRPLIPVAGINVLPGLKEILKSSFVKGRAPKKLISNSQKKNKISTFSSWGPSSNIDLKPDIAAPGDYVTTTTPMNRGKYITLRGTSFSTPHIAGLAALFLEANPDATPNDFTQALMNSATPIRDTTSLAVLSVASQGAGVANGYGLLMNKVTVSPWKISLGVIKKEQDLKLTIKNSDDRPKVFSISHLPSKLLKQRSLSSDYVNVIFNPPLDQYRIGRRTFIEIQVTFSTQNEKSLSFIDYASGFIYLEVSNSTGPSTNVTSEKIHIPYLGKLNVNTNMVAKTSNLNEEKGRYIVRL